MAEIEGTLPPDCDGLAVSDLTQGPISGGPPSEEEPAAKGHPLQEDPEAVTHGFGPAKTEKPLLR